MSRPKPPEPIRAREVRLSDSQMEKFKALGGARWLREFLDKSVIKEKETPCKVAATNTVKTTVVTKAGTVQSVWRHIVR